MTSSGKLAGKVCLVTGATRGIGKGIALQLGEAGATVYITGRTLTASKDNPLGGSLTETANEGANWKDFGSGASLSSTDWYFHDIPCASAGSVDEVEKRGGKCIPVQCDHSKDDEVERLFERVGREQDGQLDLLVNNAYTAVKCDRMAADCGHELRKHNVAFVSLWPGAVKTEHIQQQLDSGAFEKAKTGAARATAELFENAESTEYAGKAIVNLASDPHIMKKSGKIVLTGDLASEYGFVDIDGATPYNIRQINRLLKHSPSLGWLAAWIPDCLKIPRWMFSMAGSKF